MRPQPAEMAAKREREESEAESHPFGPNLGSRNECAGSRSSKSVSLSASGRVTASWGRLGESSNGHVGRTFFSEKRR